MQDRAAQLLIEAFQNHERLELLDMANNKGIQQDNQYWLSWVLT